MPDEQGDPPPRRRVVVELDEAIGVLVIEGDLSLLAFAALPTADHLRMLQAGPITIGPVTLTLVAARTAPPEPGRKPPRRRGSTP